MVTSTINSSLSRQLSKHSSGYSKYSPSSSQSSPKLKLLSFQSYLFLIEITTHTIVQLNNDNKSDVNTVDAAYIEMRQLLTNYGQIGKQERLSAVLDMLMESTNKLNSKQRKDVLKVIGIIGEVYQKAIFVSWHQVCKLIAKKTNDDDANTYLALAENVGILVQRAFAVDQDSNQEQEEEQQLRIYWKELIGLYNSQMQNGGSSSMGEKKKQIACGMCLSICIQSVPNSIVIDNKIEHTLSIVQAMQKASCPAENQLLDCLLSLIVACEEQFDDCCDYSLPFIIEQLVKEQNVLLLNAVNSNSNTLTNNTNWQKRKICIDIIYTLSVLAPNYIQFYKDQSLEILNSFKYDKIKHVREAAQVAIISIQDLPTLKLQKYIQTASSDNLSSSSRDKYLLSSQRVERSLGRSASNQQFKNITNSDIVSDLNSHLIEEEEQEQEYEEVDNDKQHNQSDTEMPPLVDLHLDQDEIDQALYKLQMLKQQDELDQSNTCFLKNENVTQKTNSTPLQGSKSSQRLNQKPLEMKKLSPGKIQISIIDYLSMILKSPKQMPQKQFIFKILKIIKGISKRERLQLYQLYLVID